ncbi:MAG: hypothetical protein AAF533_14905 [Acidobacteriota bacterium]
MLMGEEHLRNAVHEYMRHYHGERPHQGLGGELVLPTASGPASGVVACSERLGGLLRHYHREAA